MQPNSITSLASSRNSESQDVLLRAPLDWKDKVPLWGFIDRTGEIRLPPKWLSATDFHEGLASVQDSHGWHVIDQQGCIVLSNLPSSVRFQGGFAVDGERIIDITGKVLYESKAAEYEAGFSRFDKKAPHLFELSKTARDRDAFLTDVKGDKRGRIEGGVISADGKLIVPPVFMGLFTEWVGDGFIIVCHQITGKYGLIHEINGTVIQPTLDCIYRANTPREAEPFPFFCGELSQDGFSTLIFYDYQGKECHTLSRPLSPESSSYRNWSVFATPIGLSEDKLWFVEVKIPYIKERNTGDHEFLIVDAEFRIVTGPTPGGLGKNLLIEGRLVSPFIHIQGESYWKGYYINKKGKKLCDSDYTENVFVSRCGNFLVVNANGGASIVNSDEETVFALDAKIKSIPECEKDLLRVIRTDRIIGILHPDGTWFQNELNVSELSSSSDRRQSKAAFRDVVFECCASGELYHLSAKGNFEKLGFDPQRCVHYSYEFDGYLYARFDSFYRTEEDGNLLRELVNAKQWRPGATGVRHIDGHWITPPQWDSIRLEPDLLRRGIIEVKDSESKHFVLDTHGTLLCEGRADLIDVLDCELYESHNRLWLAEFESKDSSQNRKLHFIKATKVAENKPFKTIDLGSDARDTRVWYYRDPGDEKMGCRNEGLVNLVLIRDADEAGIYAPDGRCVAKGDYWMDQESGSKRKSYRFGPMGEKDHVGIIDFMGNVIHEPAKFYEVADGLGKDKRIAVAKSLNGNVACEHVLDACGSEILCLSRRWDWDKEPYFGIRAFDNFIEVQQHKRFHCWIDGDGKIISRRDLTAVPDIVPVISSEAATRQNPIVKTTVPDNVGVQVNPTSDPQQAAEGRAKSAKTLPAFVVASLRCLGNLIFLALLALGVLVFAYSRGCFRSGSAVAPSSAKADTVETEADTQRKRANARAVMQSIAKKTHELTDTPPSVLNIAKWMEINSEFYRELTSSRMQALVRDTPSEFQAAYAEATEAQLEFIRAYGKLPDSLLSFAIDVTSPADMMDKKYTGIKEEIDKAKANLEAAILKLIGIASGY